MRVMVIGSGGREHALVKALARDGRVTALFALPGNAGMKEATCVPEDPMDNAAVLAAAQRLQIDLCVVAPDDPLANGLVDALEAGGIACFGPTQAAAQIESSKVFSKELMARHGIPTAAWRLVEGYEEGLDYARRQRYPLVIKADGLAKGKGVFIAADHGQAEQALRAIFREQVFGSSGHRAVIEEHLSGPEVTVLLLTDGEHLVELPSCMDHKRALEDDKGPNTGGMGAIAPNPCYTPEIAAVCRERIYLPTLRAMAGEGRPFRGCLYVGLMLTQDGPKVLEYNARFGDPETQAVMMLVEGSPLDAFLHCRNGGLRAEHLRVAGGSACCVVVASAGYPGSCDTGHPIQAPEGDICYAGVALQEGQLVTAGGRVAAACARADSLPGAVDAAYRLAEEIRFEGRFMRRDIGRRAMQALRRT